MNYEDMLRDFEKIKRRKVYYEKQLGDINDTIRTFEDMQSSIKRTNEAFRKITGNIRDGAYVEEKNDNDNASPKSTPKPKSILVKTVRIRTPKIIEGVRKRYQLIDYECDTSTTNDENENENEGNGPTTSNINLINNCDGNDNDIDEGGDDDNDNDSDDDDKDGTKDEDTSGKETDDSNDSET